MLFKKPIYFFIHILSLTQQNLDGQVESEFADSLIVQPNLKRPKRSVFLTCEMTKGHLIPLQNLDQLNFKKYQHVGADSA